MIDDKIEKAIKELGPKVNLGQFLRTAVYFYLDSHENIRDIKTGLSLIEKKISQIATLKGENLGHKDASTDQEKRAYNRSKAISNILNMGSGKDKG